MKKFIISILIIFSFALILVCACATNDNTCTYTIAYSATDGGYIDGETTQKVESGNDGLTVVAVPNDGYEFVKWSDGSTEATRQEINVTADIAVTAEFKVIIAEQTKIFMVTYQADEGGTINGNANQSVKDGENGTKVTAMPNDGYKFVKWSDGVTEATRQDKNITKNIFVTAIFEKQNFNLSYVVGGGGYLIGNANQTVAYGVNGTEVTAIPNDGYNFVKWNDGLTEATRQDKNITKNISVTAIFEKQNFNLSYVVGGGGYLIGNANQTVAYGEDGTKITAMPNDGYKFVKWSDGVTNDTRQETEVYNEVVVTAEFEFLFAGGEGTQLNPFKIESYTQLLNMRYYPDKAYSLSCDLDLSGINHEPVFDANKYFTGVFFGGGKTIKNLTVETESKYPSLFGMVMGGVVDNLNFENISITTIDYNTQDEDMQYYVGTVAGYFTGRIDNVSVSGNIDVYSLSKGGIIGGLFGKAIGTITDCNVDVRVDAKNVSGEINPSMNIWKIGGMLGIGDTVKIRNCHVQGEINVNECYCIVDGVNKYAAMSIGGLIGHCFTSSNGNAEIIDCITNINITGDNYYKAGGFVGCLEVYKDTSMLISGCSVLGDITIGVVGGFICKGYALGELLIESCYTDCEITGYSQTAGFINTFYGANNNCIIRSCYSLSNIKTHQVYDADIIVGEGWGFAYQISDVNFVNCYSSGNIYSYHGGGFIWLLGYSKIYCCYSDCKITLFTLTKSSVFVYALTDTEVNNCYSNDIINLGAEIESNTVVVIKILRNSQINNFYYSGSDVGAFIDRISDSVVSNCHILRESGQLTDLIGEDLGDTPSIVDISDYESAEEMYFLADKLNEGLDEEVWVNQDNDFPVLNFKN